MDYEAEDRAALERALLTLRVCPRCRGPLVRVACCWGVWGCPGTTGVRDHSPETWHLPL